jgi:hypothetical protein
MATKIELETRIRELERRFENDEQDMVEVYKRIETLEAQAKADNSMVFQKAPNIVNRLLVAYDRIDLLESDNKRFEYNSKNQFTRIGVMEKQAKQRDNAHNALCDALLLESQPDIAKKFRNAINKARLPQEAQDEPQDSANEDDKRDTPNPVLQSGSADMESMSVDAIMGEAQDDVIDVMSMASHLKTYKLVEAQDETQDFTYEDDGVVKEAEQGNEQCENGSVPLLGSTETVDALMGEIRVNVETIFSDALYDEKPYEKCYRQYTERVMVYVSPIIERLMRERNEAVALDKDSCNRIDVLIRQREEQQIRAVGAEWANKELSRSEAYWKERAERAEAERNAMRECVDVLRDHHSAKYHGDWFYRRENALANYDKAQKGGGE